ncbi:maleylpyruvate isomerase N-terminal domain-containing protein [Kineosporia sp. NBRC 101731]|uniref:maleylpyruvate isomerase N-terminal domain-containing protein n=1 Tax=Kineosporia sp. NBRC 101731 TaxID=3032199 RepID=UPI00255647E8|nr:maleylpyruvate isomerase N-terminal domain-containing protein [Kineosporia sp. NBRC 101731]
METFRVESGAFVSALGRLPQDAWGLPTRCTPWSVAGVVGHVVTTVGRVPGMVDAPAPLGAEVTAVSYYRADARFSPASNAQRVRDAAARADSSSAGERGLADQLDDTVEQVVRACAGQRDDRVVLTRHGDAILLSGFLVTRVFETALHGIDVADAVGQAAWVTEPAVRVLVAMLFERPEAARALGWAPDVLLRRATGRSEVGSSDRERLTGCGLRDLALG